MARVSQTDKGLQARNVISGLRKRLQGAGKHRIGGKDYTRDEVIAMFQKHLDALDSIRAARVQLAAAVAAERSIALQVRTFTADLKAHVTSHFGSSAVTLADFGWMRPKKTGPKTVAAKADGARKAKATRVARKTMGKRQKQNIRGVI